MEDSSPARHHCSEIALYTLHLCVILAMVGESRPLGDA